MVVTVPFWKQLLPTTEWLINRSIVISQLTSHHLLLKTQQADTPATCMSTYLTRTYRNDQKSPGLQHVGFSEYWQGWVIGS